MSISQTGKKLSEETRAKISVYQKGKIVSLETRAKRSASLKGEKNPMFGKTTSQEVKDKIQNKGPAQKAGEKLDDAVGN